MSGRDRWLGYGSALGAVLVCTLLGLAMMPRFDIVNIAMVYLLAVVLLALRFNRGPALLGAALCVVAFDVVFVPPRGTFTIDDTQYLLTFAIMVVVALLISGLMQSRQRQSAIQAKLALDAETERLRSTLLASISHDLRTPLAVMTGASSSLAQGGDRLSAEERGALARSIYEQARSMSDQVAKVLQMTRLETGALVVERDWAAFSEIAGSALAQLSERLVDHRLLVEIPGDLPLVRVDATLIEQALSNLIDNAARHTPTGTLVRLRAQASDAKLLVSVEDFGPGIDERELDRVFSKFHRATRDGAVAGIGLGLAIARAIVRLHGGELWAERLPGAGTAFRFTLPLEEPPRPPRETEPEAQ